uniref:HNH endonuclease n=1 Tax=Heterorhabditis bacteriophora TaxID=37862 RepID=A0A1I7WKA3_HETBA
MTADELEESRFGRSKNYGRVHCKATYKCAAECLALDD